MLNFLYKIRHTNQRNEKNKIIRYYLLGDDRKDCLLRQRKGFLGLGAG